MYIYKVCTPYTEDNILGACLMFFILLRNKILVFSGYYYKFINMICIFFIDGYTDYYYNNY